MPMCTILIDFFSKIRQKDNWSKILAISVPFAKNGILPRSALLFQRRKRPPREISRLAVKFHLLLFPVKTQSREGVFRKDSKLNNVLSI
jgi:hypothetical protein